MENIVNPLPYIIIFSILTFVILGLITWVLSVWYKSHRCALYPNIWCSDNWICNNNCPINSPYNSCFTKATTEGLASCLFGPNAPGATVCLNQPNNNGPSCPCIDTMKAVNNCLANCAKSLNQVSKDTTCCCCPGKQGCPWKSFDDLPVQCRSGKCN